MRLPLRDLLIAAILIHTTAPIGARAQERELGPDLRMHSAVESKFLSKPRDIIVWLPPDVSLPPGGNVSSTGVALSGIPRQQEYGRISRERR